MILFDRISGLVYEFREANQALNITNSQMPMCVISIDLSGTSLIFQCSSRSWTTKCVASEYSVLLFRCRNDILVQGKHTVPAGDSQKVNSKRVRAKYHSYVGEAGGVQIFTLIQHKQRWRNIVLFHCWSYLGNMICVTIHLVFFLSYFLSTLPHRYA